jgi:hypothetical protein
MGVRKTVRQLDPLPRDGLLQKMDLRRDEVPQLPSQMIASFGRTPHKICILKVTNVRLKNHRADISRRADCVFCIHEKLPSKDRCRYETGVVARSLSDEQIVG